MAKSKVIQKHNHIQLFQAAVSHLEQTTSVAKSLNINQTVSSCITCNLTHYPKVKVMALLLKCK